MKKTLAILFIIMINLGINAADNPKYLFKIATELPDGSTWVTNIREIGKKLSEMSNGEIAIRVYPGSIMGDQGTVIKKVKIGQLSGGTFSINGLSLIYNDIAVMGFPMVFRTYQEYDYVRSKMEPVFDSEFEKNGFVLLGWSEVGLIYLYSKNKINSVDSLKYSKPWLVEGDNISLMLLKEIGATAVPLQISDVMTGLQTGLIDTIFSSHYTLIAMQWFTKVKYMADFPITLMIGAMLIDKNTFYSMPKDYQVKMKDLFRTSFDKLSQQVRSDNENALTSLKKYGMTVLPVAKTDVDRFTQISYNVAQKLTETQYSRDLLTKIRNLVQDYRSKNGNGSK